MTSKTRRSPRRRRVRGAGYAEPGAGKIFLEQPPDAIVVVDHQQVPFLGR